MVCLSDRQSTPGQLNHELNYSRLSGSTLNHAPRCARTPLFVPRHPHLGRKLKMGVRLWFGAGAVAGIVLLIFVVSMRFTTLESPSRSSPPVMEDDTGRKSELSQNKLWSSIATSMSFGPLWRDLDEILVVRPVGTPALRAVEDYISKAMEKSGWTVTHDRFSGSTPLGTKDFSNIISSRNPDVKKNRVVFAAHYDSKYFPDPNNFVGATDSAVPCAILLDLGRIISRLAPELAVDIVFFDGEEAIRDWTATDSLCT